MCFAVAPLLALAFTTTCLGSTRPAAAVPYNVNKITAKSDNPIKETLAGGVIWKQHFDGNCDVVDDETDVTPHPVSAPLKGTYKLTATVESAARECHE